MNICELPYTHDLINHYQAFSDLDGFVLLESRDISHARYDILTARPYDRFTIKRDTPDVKGALTRLQSKLKVEPSTSHLPFQGGAIGYIAYDFGAKLAGIHSKPHPLWCDMPLVDLGFYDWAIVTDHLLKKVYLLTHSEKDKQEITARWFDHQIEITPFGLLDTFKPIVSKDKYESGYLSIKQSLERGRAYQVNLTQPFMAKYRGDTWGLYTQTRIKNPVPYSAFLRLNTIDILSFSPERFLTVNDGHILTSPIKGTAKRSLNERDDEALCQALMACAKNRAENVMIVDLLRNDLGKFSRPGSVRVSALCELQSFHKVHHLVSHIESQCTDDVTPIQAFFACFPGGSITGAPKLEAMRIIHEEESFSRGLYCGSIAYFSKHGRIDSSIAIRTITAVNNHLYLPAGGGIVMDSTFEDEYQECLLKIASFTAL